VHQTFLRVRRAFFNAVSLSKICKGGPYVKLSVDVFASVQLGMRQQRGKSASANKLACPLQEAILSRCGSLPYKGGASSGQVTTSNKKHTKITNGESMA